MQPFTYQTCWLFDFYPFLPTLVRKLLIMKLRWLRRLPKPRISSSFMLLLKAESIALLPHHEKSAPMPVA